MPSLQVKAEDTIIIYPEPGDLSSVEGLQPSQHFAVQINNRPAFVYETDMGWSFVSYAADVSVKIIVTLRETLATYRVRPVDYGIPALRADNQLTLEMPPHKHIVVQVNDTQKLLISSDPLEKDPITAGSPNVVYFAPGIHHVGEGYSPPGLKSGSTIYIAGGAVVEGLFNISNIHNLSIRGRGVVAMGQWSWAQPEKRSGMVLRPNCDGLFIEGITLVKSPGWQLSIGDSNATIQNVKLLGVGNWYNSDGIQTWGDNRGTTIRDSFIFARDDALNINSGTRDYLASNLVLWNDGNGASFMFGWGGTADIRNVTIENAIVLENSSPATGVFSVRWGSSEAHIISNVTFRNIVIETATTFIDMLIVKSNWNSGTKGRIDGLLFSNIRTPIVNGIILGNNPEDSFNNISFKGLFLNDSLLTDPTKVNIFMRNVFGFSIKE